MTQHLKLVVVAFIVWFFEAFVVFLFAFRQLFSSRCGSRNTSDAAGHKPEGQHNNKKKIKIYPFDIIVLLFEVIIY